MHYIQVKPMNPDFVKLCNELDDFLNEIAGGEKNRAKYIPLNHLSDVNDVIVAYEKKTPVGCASIKHFDNEHAEVKRVFVKPQYRKKGVSKRLMELLEEKARQSGYKYLILESGEPLKAAMSLYKEIGYKIIPNYGQYRCMSDSVCMKKEL